MRRPAAKLEKTFTFAGFTFPRYIAQLTYEVKLWGSMRGHFSPCYYHAPDPTRADRGQGFYLDNEGSPNRWKWADSVAAARINHSGWYSDEDGDGELIRGIIFLLPHGRFLAGWSMGEGMASTVSGKLYNDETEAARAADQEAESAAEVEREYQAEERDRIDAEEAELERNQGGDAEETEEY